ncbi:hypothetical protein GCM10020255_092580 [Rhodococcus baikonurensis]
MIAVSLGALVLMTACTSGGKDVSTEGSAPIDSNPLTELIKPKLTSTAADGAVGFSRATRSRSTSPTAPCPT